MSHNEEELRKIKNATSGFFKKSARIAIAQSISAIRPRIENAKRLPEPQRREALVQLLDEAGEARHMALDSGANSYGQSAWAAAAACESWLFELIGKSADGIESVESLIDQLERRS